MPDEGDGEGDGEDDGEAQLIIEPGTAGAAPKLVVPVAPQPAKAPGPAAAIPAFAPTAVAASFPSLTPVAALPRIEEGDFTATSPLRLLHRLAVQKDRGLLAARLGPVICELYLAEGAVEAVPPSTDRDGFGDFLVQERVIADGELSLALAMRPHFGGSLSEALLGLGLLKKELLLDRRRHYTRRTVLDLLGWTQGTFRFERGGRGDGTSVPLGLDLLELLGAAAFAAPPDFVHAWAKPLLPRFAIAVPGARGEPDGFRLGPYPRELCTRLTGQLTVRDHLTLCRDPAERVQFLRTLRLLVETEIVIIS